MNDDAINKSKTVWWVKYGGVLAMIVAANTLMNQCSGRLLDFVSTADAKSDKKELERKIDFMYEKLDNKLNKSIEKIEASITRMEDKFDSKLIK